MQALAPQFQAVNEGMQAQSTGAEQITEALAHLGEAVQQTVETLRESSQIIDDLNHAATGMHRRVASHGCGLDVWQPNYDGPT